MLLLCALLALVVSTAWAAPALPVEVRYVDCVNGEVGNDGRTWETATENLRAVFGSLPPCVWSYVGPACASVEIHIGAGTCVEPEDTIFPTVDTSLRGAGMDATRIGGFAAVFYLQGMKRARYLLEGIGAPGVLVYAPDGDIEIRDSELGRVYTTQSNLQVEHSVFRPQPSDPAIRYLRSLTQGTLEVRDSIAEGPIVVIYGNNPDELHQGSLGTVLLEDNTVRTDGGPAVVLFALGDSRMTAILRDNVLLGSPAIQAVGQVTEAGNQH